MKSLAQKLNLVIQIQDSGVSETITAEHETEIESVLLSTIPQKKKNNQV